MAQYSSVFKMRTSNKNILYKNTINNTVDNKAENWFKERMTTHLSKPQQSLSDISKPVPEEPIKLIKPPGLTLQKNVFTVNEINELLLLPIYSDFLYINIDMMYNFDSISKLLLRSTDYSTPQCIMMD
jgi:hypothetical protein